MYLGQTAAKVILVCTLPEIREEVRYQGEHWLNSKRK